MARYLKELPWDIETIISLLPHRYPFLLVDRVDKIIQRGTDEKRDDSEIFATKCVTFNEPFFTGHFPQKPIMPGVLIIEALAQACALLSQRPVPAGAHHWDFFIAGISDAKFRKPVVPGDRLELHGKVTRDRLSLHVFEAEARVEGTIVAQAQIMAKMIPV